MGPSDIEHDKGQTTIPFTLCGHCCNGSRLPGLSSLVAAVVVKDLCLVQNISDRCLGGI